MSLISSSCRRIIIGLGKTGLSCVRYFSRQGLPFSVVDSRVSPPGLDVLQRDYPDVPIFTGGFKRELLLAADELIISPGVALAQPEVAEAIKAGAHAIGDVEIFCRLITDKPIIAITGSNGKSTVTSLLGKMAHLAGINAAVGGNIGVPVLDLIEQPADLYILELSSFQLETTHSLRAEAATVLNISPDHIDRYASFADYHRAKQKIYRGCKTAVYNLEDPLSAPLLPKLTHCSGFTTGEPDLAQFGLRDEHETTWLCKGLERLLDTKQLKMKSRHNYANALAALALGEAVDMPLKPMLEAISQFPGLPHRCQWVADISGVSWFNDSKATNIGATIAAIGSVGEQISGHIILLAGGDGKGADFSELQPVIREYVGHVILLGQDADLLEAALSSCVPVSRATDLHSAVRVASTVSAQGDAVLLAPACASTDMFNNFEDRGNKFIQNVHELLKNHDAGC
ncbi:MAG: UDP-N-acetylmuramoyl-L-alanine--D-glutamate ligase [Endozoicomonas sp. (ex Botrylloides leachii)]|nr:UDP-N-acetylmuramoyl-L-alanine--D-glutamate ligase [Endozoicomonas sp. (ex Botrylloides leachii)]